MERPTHSPDNQNKKGWMGYLPRFATIGLVGVAVGRIHQPIYAQDTTSCVNAISGLLETTKDAIRPWVNSIDGDTYSPGYFRDGITGDPGADLVAQACTDVANANGGFIPDAVINAGLGGEWIAPPTTIPQVEVPVIPIAPTVEVPVGPQVAPAIQTSIQSEAPVNGTNNTAGEGEESGNNQRSKAVAVVGGWLAVIGVGFGVFYKWVRSYQDAEEIANDHTAVTRHIPGESRATGTAVVNGKKRVVYENGRPIDPTNPIIRQREETTRIGQELIDGEEDFLRDTRGFLGIIYRWHSNRRGYRLWDYKQAGKDLAALQNDWEDATEFGKPHIERKMRKQVQKIHYLNTLLSFRGNPAFMAGVDAKFNRDPNRYLEDGSWIGLFEDRAIRHRYLDIDDSERQRLLDAAQNRQTQEPELKGSQRNGGYGIWNE